MKRNLNLKKRESRNLPLEKLREILSTIYPENLVDELMIDFVRKKQDHLIEKDDVK